MSGPVANFQSLASFQVRNQAVDASGPAVVFSGGTAADLVNGRQVAVTGTTSGGVLVAESVTIAPLDNNGGGNGGGSGGSGNTPSPEPTTLTGAIGNYSSPASFRSSAASSSSASTSTGASRFIRVSSVRGSS